MFRKAAVFMLFLVIFVGCKGGAAEDEDEDRIYFPDEDIVMQLSRHQVDSSKYHRHLLKCFYNLSVLRKTSF